MSLEPMTEEEAYAELMVLRGIAESGSNLALIGDRIEALYFAVCGKRLRRCKCKDKYRDALLEIYTRLKHNKPKKFDKMARARLVAGVVLQWQGNHYTNANLTDEVAWQFLATFPQKAEWFSVLPPAPEKKAVEVVNATMPENSPQVASKGIKAEKQPTTPQKKKSLKKRK